MEDERVPSGSDIIDELLCGGYEKGCISTVFGPGGSGKTNVALMFMITILKQGQKAIFVDTDGSFSLSRFSQLTGDESLLNNIIFFRPNTFAEQKKAFVAIREMVDILGDKIGTIIVDSIAMLYRLELGKSNDVYEINKELGKQLSYLIEIARTRNMPIIITNQVYSVPTEPNRVNMVGGDLLKYASKCLIELKKYKSNIRVGVLRKHRSLPEKKMIKFKIVENGIIPQ